MHSPARAGTRIAGLAIVAVLVAACGGGGAVDSTVQSAALGSTSTPASASPLVVTPYVADEFFRTVVRDQADGRRYVVKWEAGRDVRVTAAGAPTDADLALIDEALARFSAAVPLDLERVGSDADITVHFTPKDDWATIVDDPLIDLTPAGWTYTYSAGSADRPNVAGVLTDADIVIDSAAPQAARNRVIAHELGHALGLGHATCAATLMYDGDDARPLWSPSPLDDEMLRVLYDPRVEAGMATSDIDAVLDRSGVSGPLCGTVQWELVEFQGDSYYCGAFAGAQPCIRFTGTEPSGPITSPDGWVLDGRFASFNPDLWTEYVFEGQRLLCERSGSEVAPCVLFDGANQPTYPVTSPAYWTDGEFIYDSPPG